MIYTLGYTIKDEKFIKRPIKYTFFGDDINPVLKFIEINYLNEDQPLFIIQKLNSDILIEIELKEGIPVRSYILDLFDFEKEFLSLLE
jgi:hypothetical protein